MKRTSIAVVFAVLLAGIAHASMGPMSAHAQEPALDIHATFSATDVYLGERLHLVVLVQHPADVLVSVEPPARSAALQLVQILPSTESPSSSEVASRFEYVLAAFSLGDIQLPPIRVSWLNAAGETGSLLTIAPPFAVRPISATDDRTLRPLKPQMSVAGAPPFWQQPRNIAIAAGTPVLLAILVMAVAFLRRRRPRPGITSGDSGIEGAARTRLDALAAAAPLANGDYDAYYGTIAAVVRDFLQERFGFGARALTTTELQQRMVALGVERWQARLVGGLLDRCDGAVYAGRQPDPASADHDLTVAFEIIELSRPPRELAEARA